ncbi:unnamed protein product [Cylindrotheca closterium]|uniref:Peroxisomal membrane protein MPV17 n=1 Tax=Cylindrotheca closterium TaxID=2856 RepID=A0AAD2CW60_9STRA|nr:unnamed protein product [Cylindrotheca closterium]
MFFRKHPVYNVLLTVIICNSVLTTALATNSRIGLARRSWTFHTKRATSVPRTFESNNAREYRLKQGKNPIDKRHVVKSVTGATLGFLLIKNRFVFEYALNLYRSSLSNSPLQTKVLTGATLSLLGDWAAQIREGNESTTYDMKRGLSFAAFDSTYRMFQHVAIPVIVRLGQGNFLLWLVTIAPFVNPGPKASSFFAAMERTLIYQFVLIPLAYYPVFFTFTGLMQGLSLSETFARAKRTFFPCWIKNVSFWIPTQLVMFGLVDEKWQVPFVCLVGVLWSSILSITAGKARVEN